MSVNVLLPFKLGEKKVLIFLSTEDLSGPSFNQATQMHDTFTLIN